MADLKSHPETNTRQLRRLILNTIFRNVLVFSFSSAIMFLAAGRLNWIDAILFWIGYFLISLVSGLYLIKIDSNLMKERQNAISRKNVQPWDRRILAANMLLTTGLFIMIGLDAGRFGWSQVPVIMRVTGGVLMLLSFALTLWASRTNTFMSSQVRIQAERGHQVISSGPYAVIRHPMYAGMCMLDVGMPLLLNSWYGLIVSVLMIALVILRVTLEEKLLNEELPGYSDFRSCIKFRLIPGIW